MKSLKWYIGCSGFAYKEWIDFFYPSGIPQSRWFQHYCEHFNTLEINSTFYRFPKAQSLRTWYNKSPDDFLFSVKVPKFITHYRHLTGESERMLGEFYELLNEGLSEKLGCVLFQMPSKFHYNEENLERVTSLLNNNYLNTIEFRHESWWNTNTYTELKKNNIIFCGHSYPGLPDNAIATTTTIYYRFHGVPVLYKSEYNKRFLKNIFDQISNHPGSATYLYFNNTWGTSAITNAKYIQKVVEKHLKTNK